MLEEFSTGFFKYCLSKYPLPGGEVIDSILIMFWRGQFRIDTLLNIWITDKSLNSTLHFKDLYMDGFKMKNPSRMSSAFGEEEISKIIRTWIDSVNTKTFFRESIESLIMDEVDIEETQLNQLNVLYEMIK